MDTALRSSDFASAELGSGDIAIAGTVRWICSDHCRRAKAMKAIACTLRNHRVASHWIRLSFGLRREGAIEIALLEDEIA